MALVYFRGCIAREKLKSISEATEALLKSSGVNYTLIKDETCCGSTLLRTGFPDDARSAMEKTADKIKGRTVIVSCAGCYRTFLKDYPRMGFDILVKHTSQFLLELLREGRLRLKRGDLKVTYHDPCHLSRHTDETDAPRRLLREVAEVLEMDKHGKESRCCGAGGGVRSAYRDLSTELAAERLKEARGTGADLLCTSCPFCRLNLESSLINVLDISELLRKLIDTSGEGHAHG